VESIAEQEGNVCRKRRKRTSKLSTYAILIGSRTVFKNKGILSKRFQILRRAGRIFSRARDAESGRRAADALQGRIILRFLKG
jgi:hypothetical protein